MSLRYLWNKLANMDSLEQEAYIKNIFEQFGIKPLYPIEDNFVDTPGKESKSKNPLGYILMHLNEEQLDLLIPEYLRSLCEQSTFNSTDSNIYDTIYRVGDAIDFKDSELLPNFDKYYDVSDMLEVFNFGVVKYSPWSFLKLNPYTLIPALFRHLYKYHYISKVDEETNVSHLAHAACNIRMIDLIIKKEGKKDE